MFLQELNDAIINVTDDVSEFCGTSDPDLFANIIGTNLKYICGVIGLLLDVGKVFQCNTWMPLYYNTGTLMNDDLASHVLRVCFQ